MKYIVDLDGTLVDLNADWTAVKAQVRQALEAHGLTYDTKLPMDENIFKLKPQIGPFRTLCAQIAMIECKGLAQARVNHDLIARLKRDSPDGFAIFSANCRATLEAVFALPVFSGVRPKLLIGKDDVSHPKPHPAGVELILDQLKWPRREVTYLGDSKNDQACAEAAGVLFQRISW